jgi:hypothetical protein
MFDANTFNEGEKTMSSQTYSSHSAVAATVTSLACAWFLVAGATMIASPTDGQVARGAHVTVQPGRVMPERVAPASVAIAPEAHFKITVEARRA